LWRCRASTIGSRRLIILTGILGFRLVGVAIGIRRRRLTAIAITIILIIRSSFAGVRKMSKNVAAGRK
jgi:hypothetical protein